MERENGKRWARDGEGWIYAPPQASCCKPHWKKNRDRGACVLAGGCWALERNDGTASPGGWLSIWIRGLGDAQKVVKKRRCQKKHSRQGRDADAREKDRQGKGPGSPGYEKGTCLFLVTCNFDKRGKRAPASKAGHEGTISQEEESTDFRDHPETPESRVAVEQGRSKGCEKARRALQMN